MDRETIEKVNRKLEQISSKEDISLDEVVVFGSRARDDYRESSDVDILIVSRDFEGKPWNKRPGPFYRHWDYDELPEPEYVCLTPEEFEEKRKRKPHIVREAVETGVRVT